MTYVTGYGSSSYPIPDATTALQAIATNTEECVLDSISVDSRSTGIASIAIVIADGDGNTVWETELDPSAAAAVRDGLYCGPYGRRMPRGLQVSAAAGLYCHVHYRVTGGQNQ